jgi:hypothetical protein
MAVAVKNACSLSFLRPIERARRISHVRTVCATVPSMPARVAYNVRACWSFLALARILEGGVGLFIWPQNQHFRGGLGAAIMQSTRSTHREWKPDPKARLPMPIRDMPSISTGLPRRTDHPFGLPINEKVAVTETVCCV